MTRDAGVASVGLVAVLGASAAFLPGRGSSTDWPSAIARTATFTDSILETGTLNAARLMLYSAPTGAGQSKIVEIAPEGTAAKTGDVLIRFDDATLRQALEKEEATLQLADGELLRAREDWRLEQLRAQGEVQQAQQQIGFAESGLANQLEGRGRLEVAEAEAATTEARREVDRTRATHEDMKPMLAEGFITRVELERAEQASRRAQEQLALAEFKLSTLTRYERPAAIDKSKAEVNGARDAFVRLGESAAARLAQRQAAVGMAQSHVAEIGARAAFLRDQIVRTVVRAGGPGLVVYRDLFFGSDRRKPQVGDEVFPNQQLIAVPDSSRLIVETRVREVDLHRVTASQQVIVTADAYPDVRLAAKVALVGALAQEDPARAGTKFFPVTIEILDADPRLRAGMTARVEIHVLSLPRATVVPLEAVFEQDGRSHCFVIAGRRPERRPVVVAGRNATAVAIEHGIDSGDRVLLVDPGAGSQP